MSKRFFGWVIFGRHQSDPDSLSLVAFNWTARTAAAAIAEARAKKPTEGELPDFTSDQWELRAVNILDPNKELVFENLRRALIELGSPENEIVANSEAFFNALKATTSDSTGSLIAVQ